MAALADPEHVVERLPMAAPMGCLRLRYLSWLRDPALGESRSRCLDAKTELLRLRAEAKSRRSVPLTHAVEATEAACAVVVLALSAQGSADLGIRRTIDQVLYWVRCELAAILTKLADQRGEPPLETRILTNAARHLA